VEETLIEEGVEICSCCNGKGYKPANNLVLYEFCAKCKGKGRVDWVANIVPASQDSYMNKGSYDLSDKCKQHNIHELVRQIQIEYQEVGIIVNIDIKALSARSSHMYPSPTLDIPFDLWDKLK